MSHDESEITPSPPWGGMTKAFVALAILVVVAGLLIRFHTIVPLLIVSGILAYLVLPVVRYMTEKTPLSWGWVTNLLFLLLILIFLGASTATGFAIVSQLQSLFFTVQDFLFDLPGELAALADQPIVIGPWTLDLASTDLSLLAEQALAAVQPLLGQMSSLLSSLATGAIESVGGIFFMFVIGYFVVFDANPARGRLSNLAIPELEGDFRRLLQALTVIWNRFLRGQLVMVALAGLTMWLAMSILGVRYALGLGVLASIAKFVPFIGPLIAGGTAALVALFQPTNWLGLSPLAHALIVIIVQILVDQSLDLLVQPRVMGTTLNLHPVFLLVGAIVAASLAGMIGLLLSAPAIATMMLISRYIYRKMADLSPWDPAIDHFPDPPKTQRRSFWKRWRRKPKPSEEP
jgi:predicted PurR-regulated permease PerM